MQHPNLAKLFQGVDGYRGAKFRRPPSLEETRRRAEALLLRSGWALVPESPTYYKRVGGEREILAYVRFDHVVRALYRGDARAVHLLRLAERAARNGTLGETGLLSGPDGCGSVPETVQDGG